MQFRRLLRIFIPLLVIAAIVAGVIIVLTSRSELQSSRRLVNESWAQLQGQLDTRFEELKAANDAVRTTPGPLKRIVAQTDSAYTNWRELQTNGGSVAAQVTAANTLEALGRRLVQAARAAPRLRDKPALETVNAFAADSPPGAAAAFDAAVTRYERERNRPARRLAAGILGYKAVPAYDASGSA
jgi:hypothetical protein